MSQISFIQIHMRCLNSPAVPPPSPKKPLWAATCWPGSYFSGPPAASVCVVQASARLFAVFATGCVSACTCVPRERRDATARPRKSDGDGGGNEKDGADGRGEISERGLRHVRPIIAFVWEGNNVKISSPTQLQHCFFCFFCLMSAYGII